MAFRRKNQTTKKPYKRRRAYRRRRKAFGPTRMVSSTSPVPDRYFTKLKYSTLSSLTFTGGGNPVALQYRLNSCYRPYDTDTHQPLGWDQVSALYGKYRVHGCKYYIMFTNRETLNQMEVAVQIRPDTQQFSSYNTLCETPYVTKRTLGVEGSGQANKVVKGYVSIAKICGVTKQQMRIDDRFQALVTATPSQEPCLNIYTQNQITSTNGTVAFRVELEYFVEFFERVKLSGS